MRSFASFLASRSKSRKKPVQPAYVVPDRDQKDPSLSVTEKLAALAVSVKNIPPRDEEPIVVAVMGVTGTGKSSFIKLVSGRSDVKVGDTLASETTEICAYEFYHEGRFFILVDTPGFDDTNRPDTEITNKLLQWLKDSMLAGQKLNGVVYLHRINDTRMGGTALRNTRMFRKLVGDQAFSSVILATTFWEEVPRPVAIKREAELRRNKDFWGAMIDKGAKMDRLTRDRATGLRILLEIAQKDKVVFQAQDELVNQGKPIEETAAAGETRAEIERVQRELELQRWNERRRIEREMNAQRMQRADAIEQERIAIEKKMREAAQADAKEREQQEAKHQRRLQDAKQELEAERERLRLQQQEELDAIRSTQEEAERQQYSRRRELAEKYGQQYECLEYDPDPICDHCYNLIGKYEMYYHCCLCLEDRYIHCLDCLGDCGVPSHPYMDKHTTPLGYLISNEAATTDSDSDSDSDSAEAEQPPTCLETEPDEICDGCYCPIGCFLTYYHCCLCHQDRFVHCLDCGNDCGESSHPYMTEYSVPISYLANHTDTDESDEADSMGGNTSSTVRSSSAPDDSDDTDSSDNTDDSY